MVLSRALPYKWRDLPPWGREVLIGMIAVFLIVSGYFLITSGKIISSVSVAGVKVGGMKTTAVEAILAQKIHLPSKRKIVITYQGKNFPVNLNSLGVEFDPAVSARQAYQLGRTGPIWLRLWERWETAWRGRDLSPVYKYNADLLESFCRILDTVVDKEAIPARVTVDRKGKVSVSPSQDGRRIDFNQLTRLLEQAICNQRIRRIALPVNQVKPALTQAEIAKWSLDQPLGYYSTIFNTKLPDRVHNLENASKALNNVLIQPGDTFSFNSRVGPRVLETGYREAPVVLLNKLVPGIGGGVCQVSSTLYNAVLFSNLKIIQRANHSLPSAYIPLARDATVVYDGIDFIFQNNLKTPILITAEVRPPYLTVAIFGQKSDWETVSLETVILKTYPFGVKEIPDPERPLGERFKDLEGKDGYLAELWRVVRYTGGRVERRRENVSIYPPQPEEYKIGTKLN